MKPLLLALLILFSWPAAADATLEGPVTHVRDGDTIEVSRIPIRFNGVSAPELDEHLGQASKAFMIDLVNKKRVHCELNGEKTYDRFVGVCYLDDQDIGAAVIKAGLALDCPRFSGGRYREFETVEARQRIKLPGYCRAK
ncbi:MAG: thermonuclease family protein [Rhodospirillales bacterium]